MILRHRFVSDTDPFTEGAVHHEFISNQEVVDYWLHKFKAIDWLLNLDDEHLMYVMVYARGPTENIDPILPEDLLAFRRAMFYALSTQGPSDLRTKLLVEYFETVNDAVVDMPDPYLSRGEPS